MPDISFTGIGSGLQVKEIVDALVNSEKVPFEARLTKQAAAITTDISAMGGLKSAIQSVATSLEALSDADNYQKRTTAGSDNFVSLSATKDAQLGSYAVEVDNLAASHKLMSTGFAATDAVGEGTLTLSSGTDSFDITVGATDKLSDIRDAINDSADNDSVLATIVTDDAGQHLILTSKETGKDNAIKIVVNDVGDANNTDNLGLSRLAYDPEVTSPTFATNLTQITAATDAQITIDGSLTVSSSSNVFKGVIDGVDITAKKAHDTGDDPSQISFSENNSNIQSGIEQFVKTYNELISLGDQLGGVSEGAVGPLAGDALLRGVLGKMRSQLSESFSVGTDSTLTLAELGVTSDRYGKLSLDTEKLTEQINKDVAAVQSFFVGEDDKDGFAKSLTTLTEFYTESDGIIQGRLDGKTKQLERLDDEQIEFSRKMESLESRLLAQYNAMDLLVANLNSTSSYVQAQLDNMPGVVKKDS